MAPSAWMKSSVLVLGMCGLAACEDTPNLGFLNNSNGPSEAATTDEGPVVVEREREAPEVFSKNEAALWDGRPSLGGIWVAHPDVDDPQRVIMRNEANGKFVIGALFRRERDLPGPKLQVSSDAASELGMLAGAPADLSVVALIREAVPVEVEAPAPTSTDGEIETQTLDPVAALAAQAINNAEAPSVKPQPRPGSTPAPQAKATPTPKPAPTPAPAAASKLKSPFVQVGIFSSEENANTAADQMRKAGVIPTIKPFSSNGKSFWRVIVGPVTTAADQKALLNKLGGLGYGDAYPVSR